MLTLCSSRIAVAFTLAGLAACTGRQVERDVTEVPPDTCSASCRDAGAEMSQLFDAGVHDSADHEAATVDAGPLADAGDAGPMVDTTVPDSSMVDSSSADARPADARADVVVAAGPCTLSGTRLSVLMESRSLPRLVYVSASGSDFTAGMQVLQSGLNNVFSARVDSMSRSLGLQNISEETGALVEGGSLAPNASGSVMAFSSNRTGNLEVYVRSILADGSPDAPAVMLSNDAAFSGGARIVAYTGGWMVVWRSDDPITGGKQLIAASVQGPGFTPSPPVNVTPTGVVVDAFDVSADGSRVAVAYIGASAIETPNAHVVELSTAGPSDAGAAAGSPLRPPVALTTGSSLTGAIGAALHGDTLAVTWTEDRFEGSLHARRVHLDGDALDPVTDLPQAGAGAYQPALAVNGTSGYVIAFRDRTRSPPIVGMMRLDGALTPIDGVSSAGPAGEGESPRVVAMSGGLFALGWADASSAGTVGSVQVMRCP